MLQELLEKVNKMVEERRQLLLVELQGYKRVMHGSQDWLSFSSTAWFQLFEIVIIETVYHSSQSVDEFISLSSRDGMSPIWITCSWHHSHVIGNVAFNYHYTWCFSSLFSLYFHTQLSKINHMIAKNVIFSSSKTTRFLEFMLKRLREQKQRHLIESEIHFQADKHVHWA